jgi:ABC-type enterochelin transport system substrate-binding protein
MAKRFGIILQFCQRVRSQRNSLLITSKGRQTPALLNSSVEDASGRAVEVHDSRGRTLMKPQISRVVVGGPGAYGVIKASEH